jgi:hypothetical protein
MANVAGIFKAVAPWLFAGASTLLPGPLAQAASKIGAIIGKPDLKADLQTISEAVAGATPEQLAQIRTADQAHEAEMQKAGFQHIEDLLNAEYADTANARAREVSIRDKMPAVLGITVTVGFFGLVTLLAFHAFPEATKDTLLLLIGALTVGWKDVMGYYFGSSAGSQEKDSTIQNLSK